MGLAHGRNKKVRNSAHRIWRHEDLAQHHARNRRNPDNLGSKKINNKCDINN